MNTGHFARERLPTPQPDGLEISKALAILAGEVVELRALTQRGGKRTHAGYFDAAHHADLTREAERLNAAGAAVYVTLNPTDPQLLGRYSNRIEQYAQSTTTDANIIRRRWLLLDFDPVRPKDTSATDAQLASAKETARACYTFLRERSWPEPVVAESGNGLHMLYRLDLANTPEVTVVVKAVLNTLADRFDTEEVKLDRTVFNAARIVKLYGTVANKGDHTPEAPWRVSHIVRAPDPEGVVTTEQLRTLAPVMTVPNRVNGEVHSAVMGDFDLEGFLSRLGIEWQHDVHSGADRYRLAHCPFNPEHGKGEAAVFRGSSGALGFKCQHNECADKHWKDVRALLDGPTESRRPRAGAGTGEHPGSPSSIDGTQEWPEPLPLPEGLPPVAPFDLALLPETLQPWARDICERVQCPSDYVGATIMAALGSVIGRKVGVRPQALTDWTEFTNQWALVVGRPGVLKSPAMEAALSPLKRLAAMAAESHGAAMEEYQRSARLAKLRAEASEKAARAKLAKNPGVDISDALVSDGEEAPALRRYIANDTTAAALGELLRQNPNGLLVFRDELVSLLKVLDREDNAEARGFYLTGWNGNSAYTFDRIGRGMNLHIPAVCLSLLGSTQPGRIAEYLRAAVRGGSGDDGLIQRFGLLVWPDTSGAWHDIDRWPDTEARRKANAVFEALDRLDADKFGAEKDEFEAVPFLRFGSEALELFREWREGWEAKLRGGDLHPALESHLAKYRKLVPALALTLHLADGGTGQIGQRATLQALAWAEYLETHARRAYASVSSPEVTAAKAILDKLRRGELSRTFAARDIYRRAWAHLSERQHVLDALQLLADLDRLAVHTRDTGGRAATIYEANPRGLES